MYKHYWWQHRTFRTNEWKQIQNAMLDIRDYCHQQGVHIAQARNRPETQPIITSQNIRFNGIDPDGCDVFWMNRVAAAKEPAHFCKTNRQPYDLAVATLLLFISNNVSVDCFSLTSDGDWEDAEWVRAREAYQTIFNAEPFNTLKAPTHEHCK